MKRVDLSLQRIEDDAVTDAFTILIDEVLDGPFTGFRGKHVVITKAAGTYEFAHHLGFRPKDVIQTALNIRTGTTTWTWNYDDFTATHVSFTVTTSVANEEATVRAYIGTHTEE